MNKIVDIATVGQDYFPLGKNTFHGVNKLRKGDFLSKDYLKDRMPLYDMKFFEKSQKREVALVRSILTYRRIKFDMIQGSEGRELVVKNVPRIVRNEIRMRLRKMHLNDLARKGVDGYMNSYLYMEFPNTESSVVILTMLLSPGILRFKGKDGATPIGKVQGWEKIIDTIDRITAQAIAPRRKKAR